MSNAAAAYYAYLAIDTRERARVFRNFGYLASADHLDRRADFYQGKANLEAISKEAPQDEPYGASMASQATETQDDNLHRTSEG